MALTRSDFFNLNNDYDAYSGRSMREAEEMKKLAWMQQQAMANLGFTPSGTGAVNAVVEKPSAPKHLNPKLLLTKGV